MPFSRPSRAQLQAQILADIQSVTGFDLLRRAVLRAVAWAQAGIAWLHYGYLDWIARQAVPWTATDEYLYAWAALKGVTRLPATVASGTATFSGVNGRVLPVGTAIASNAGTAYVTTSSGTVASGTAYVTTSSGTVASGTVTVAVAAVQAGAAGNAAAGTTLALSAAIDGINAAGTAATALTGGADAETADALRTRMLQRYQAPPQGGARNDYVAWAKEVAGVTRAWTRPNGMGPGTVVVYTMFDSVRAAYSGFPQGTNGVATGEPRAAAATGDQLLVANAILPLQPVTALVYAAAPVAAPVAITIADLDGGDQAAIVAALDDLFLRIGAPGGTTYPVAIEGTPNGVIFPSDISAAIASVAGVNRFTLAAPTARVTAAAGYLPTRGVVTFS